MKNTGAGVVNVPLKGLHVVRSNGRTYYYAWRGGPRIDAPFGAPEFHAAFAEAKSPTNDLDKKRLAAWITLYKASDEYEKIADSTKRLWAPWFDHIRDEFGKLSIRQFDRPRIRVDIKHWRAKWKDRPRAADTGKQVLSRVLSYAVSEGALSTNPCEGVPNLYESNRAEIIWTDDDLALLCKHASKEVAAAAKLASLTGLRYGDLFKLSWSHVGANAIEIKTGKSRGKRGAIVPIYDAIRELLKTIPRRSTVVLTNSKGKPWKGFSSSWNKEMKDAGLADRDLHFHDLRGTAATKFFIAGFSIREIAETLAWLEERVERLIDRYVKRDEIMLDRIRRLEKSRGSNG
ncbi:MAG TPA: tyrosine-type recombinase/integrase [Rhizomicrobium sp.]|nr:tyrosine-type recombinase/integrase [Rhizomicrobium sp.]